MGNKIITEKDYWRCTGGLMPASFQNNDGKAKKESGETFITKKNTATLSTMDFSCTKLMLVMAILAAIIAVAIIATGGAGLAVLVAAGAAAGAGGAAYGAVLGSMLCGQKVALARRWESFKSAFKIQGQEAITGKDVMLCPIFGDKITLAPEIKNWHQALAEGGANLIAGVLEGMLAGAAIGLGGGMIGGARAAFMQGGTKAVAQASLNVLKSAPVNIFKNYVGTWTSSLGLGLRSIMATETMLRSYSENQNVTGSDFKKGTLGMEYGTAHSAQNIATGQGTWHDYVGMALWITPVHKINDQSKTNSKKTKATEESTKTHKGNEGKVGEKAKGEFEAFEESLIDGKKKYSLSNKESRKWYLEKEKSIPDLIDKSLLLEQQAKQAFELRNKFRKNARELMNDRVLAEELNANEKNMTWKEVLDKTKKKGFSGDEVYREIIESSQRSRKSVNKKLGLD